MAVYMYLREHLLQNGHLRVVQHPLQVLELSVLVWDYGIGYRHERVRFGSSMCGIIHVIMHDRQWKESMKKNEACIYQKAVQWFCVNS